ncbi:hypothetical protein [Clostridium uliginosum]|uniref:Putative cell wall binding repeat-containing protein n=1 Tax=Clostridium uliginosum TaxID=119641 RepID=A0A1I1GSF5_9CLOT|nr:hypothetical protein [Clostridium uliginosum]SFC14584.1 Putative cell wall binding repeat-containing protein [Clostridium uliginosum]
MKKLRLTKVIASSLIVASVLALNPIGVNAEWRSDSKGWWYEEGSSWAVGWKQIGDNWYYFDSHGYMAKNIIINGYILGIDGAWVENDPNVNATFPKNKINIKDYKITVFYVKETGEICKCVDGVKTYSVLDASANQEELKKVYGIIVMGKDVEIQYGYKNFKVVNGKVIYKK